MDIAAIRDQQEQEQELSAGTLLDNMLRKVSTLDLIDYMLASYISAPKREVQIFFSGDTPIDVLEELKNSVDSGEFVVELEETTVEGAGFVLRAKGEVEKEMPVSAPVQGIVDIGVEFSGELDVT